MSTWLELYNAHRLSAVQAYGYYSATARTPNMSTAFARALLDGWIRIGFKSETFGEYQAETFGGGQFRGFLAPIMTRLQEDYDGLSSDDFVANPLRIWSDVFSLASLLDGGSIPGPSFVGAVRDVFTDAKDYVKETLEQGLQAISAPLSDLALIGLAALGILLLLEFRR